MPSVFRVKTAYPLIYIDFLGLDRNDRYAIITISWFWDERSPAVPENRFYSGRSLRLREERRQSALFIRAGWYIFRVTPAISGSSGNRLG